MSGTFIRYEMVKAMSATEGLMFVAGKIFGEKEPEIQEVSSVDEMQALAREINGR